MTYMYMYMYMYCTFPLPWSEGQRSAVPSCSELQAEPRLSSAAETPDLDTAPCWPPAALEPGHTQST